MGRACARADFPLPAVNRLRLLCRILTFAPGPVASSLRVMPDISATSPAAPRRRKRRWLRRVLVVMALAMLVLAWNLSMDSGESPPKLAADAPQPVAKDITPDGIAPGFKPSAPAQPPK